MGCDGAGVEGTGTGEDAGGGAELVPAAEVDVEGEGE